VFQRARDIDGVVAHARAGARCWLGIMAVLCASTREDKNKMKKYRLAKLYKKCSHAHSLRLHFAFYSCQYPPLCIESTLLHFANSH
jgi:hypothetical protein